MILNKSYSQFLLGFLVSVAYIPGIIGASINTGWLVLLIVMPMIVWFYKLNTITNYHILGSLFLIYASVSLLWTYNLNISFFILLQFVVLGLVFYYGSAITNLKFIVQGIALGLLISNIVAAFQYFGYYFVYSINGPSGLYVNINIFCEMSAILLVTLLVFELYYWLPVTIPGLLIHSRAAILSLLVCFLVWLWQKSKSWFSIITPFLFVAGYLTYGHSSLATIQQRFDLWADTIRGFKIFGNGIGSFEILYPLNAVNIDTVLTRPKYAHNDLLQIGFDLGIGSLLLVAFLWSILTIKCKEAYILYAFCIVSLFAFPLHNPVSAFLVCLVAGFITRIDTSRSARTN